MLGFHITSIGVVPLVAGSWHGVTPPPLIQPFYWVFIVFWQSQEFFRGFLWGDTSVQEEQIEQSDGNNIEGTPSHTYRVYERLFVCVLTFTRSWYRPLADLVEGAEHVENSFCITIGLAVSYLRRQETRKSLKAKTAPDVIWVGRPQLEVKRRSLVDLSWRQCIGFIDLSFATSQPEFFANRGWKTMGSHKCKAKTDSHSL